MIKLKFFLIFAIFFIQQLFSMQKELTQILPADVWREIMDYLQGDNKFLNYYLVQHVKPNNKTVENILHAIANKSKKLSFRTTPYKRTKLKKADNALYQHFKPFRKLHKAIINCDLELAKKALELNSAQINIYNKQKFDFIKKILKILSDIASAKFYSQNITYENNKTILHNIFGVISIIVLIAGSMLIAPASIFLSVQISDNNKAGIIIYSFSLAASVLLIVSGILCFSGAIDIKSFLNKKTKRKLEVIKQIKKEIEDYLDQLAVDIESGQGTLILE